MRRVSLGFATSLAVILLGLLLPATTAAAYPYTTTVERNTCVTTGGLHGYGYVRLKVLQKEWGVSGTNYFAVRIQVQERKHGTSTWSALNSMTNVTESFPNDSASISWEQNRRYDFSAFQVANFDHRIAMRFRWWDMRPGPDVLLSQKTVYGHVC